MQTNYNSIAVKAEQSTPIVVEPNAGFDGIAAGILVLTLPLALVIGITCRKRYVAHRKKVQLLQQIALLEKIWHMSSNRPKK